MAIQRTTPQAVTNATTTLNSLSASSTVGKQSAVVNSSTAANVTDITANWDINFGAVAAAAGARVDVYCWGTNDDAGYPGSTSGNEIITGTAGDLVTIGANGTTVLKFLKQTLASAASAIAHTVRDEASVVAALGFVPRRWGLVFLNQSGAALGSTSNAIEYVETYYN